MPKPDIQPRKSPRQSRSIATVAVILEAATRVLARESLEGFNTNRVAEVAGVSVGSVYQYFPNKAALVTALIDRAQGELADSLEALVAQLDEAPLEESLHAVASLAIRQQYGNPVLASALDHEEKRLPVQAHLRKFEARIVACTAMLLQRHAKHLSPGLSKGLPTTTARDCLVITKALVEADAELGRKPPPDLADRIVRALMGYLCWNPTARK
jgi:AcrR family transcriptional regulator